ncbi:MAG TPA: RHS repeat-associated core domain-containing protein [Thermoanaerobaculia bacterium]|nr:RHS repeat-associated core domain-containing protein [Thermoanaerobaculia bacterium]
MLGKMRRFALVGLLAVAQTLFADDPPKVPQAVAALEQLKSKANAGPVSWTNGPYGYDGAGNITAIGNEAFVYDKIGRLKGAIVRGPDLTALQTQTFLYDDYGNLTSTSKLGQTVSLPANALTNRLEGIDYDAAGNVTAIGVQHYDYDALGMLNAIRVGTSLQPRIVYAYTADDERLLAFDVSANITHWTLRSLDNKVLRDFKQQGSMWSVERDYVYRDGLLLAALKSSGAVEHYTLDHLGTPRLVTDGAGRKIGYHAYWPFGEEWTSDSAQEGSPLQFTGHERDAGPSGGAAPLDYMHARYYQGTMGRFLAVDDTGPDPDDPRTFNRYGYVLGSPVRFYDPYGLFECDDKGNCREQVTVTGDRPRTADEEIAAFIRRGFERFFYESALKDPKRGATAAAMSSFFVRFNGPSISKYGNGRIFQVRFGTDPNRPRLVRLDIGPLTKGGDPRLHINYQQHGKGSPGFNRHVTVDPRSVIDPILRSMPMPRPPLVPLVSPCLVDPRLCYADPFGEI